MNINNMLDKEPAMQDRSPKGQIFSIESAINNLMTEYDMVVESPSFGANPNNVSKRRAQMIADKIDELQQQKIGIQSQMGDEKMTDAMHYFFKTYPPGFDRDRMSRIEIEMEEKAKKQREEYQRWKKQNHKTIPELAGGGEASSQHMMPDGTPMPGSNHQEYEAMMMQQRQMMAGGGTPFPDLTGDGQITQADILKGRGVYAGGGAPFDISVRNSENEKFAFQVLRDMQKNPNLPNELTAEQKQMFEHGLIMGGEQGIFMDTVKRMKSQGMNYQPSPNMANMYTAHSELLAKDRAAQDYKNGGEAIGDELEGMEMTEEQAMAEVGVAEKEMQMIQQLVAVVQQLIAEGLGEKDIVAFLKEQGLDDEDIDSLMQMVLQAQSGQAPEGIDQQLQGMM